MAAFWCHDIWKERNSFPIRGNLCNVAELRLMCKLSLRVPHRCFSVLFRICLIGAGGFCGYASYNYAQQNYNRTLNPCCGLIRRCNLGGVFPAS